MIRHRRMHSTETEISTRRRWWQLWADQTGVATIEYSLLLAAVALPMMVLFRKLLIILAEMYKMVTFLIGLPFF